MKKIITLLLMPSLLLIPLSLTAQKKDANTRALLKEFQKAKAESRRVFENLLTDNENLSSENRRLFIELEDTTHNLNTSQESLAESQRKIEKLKNEIALLEGNPSGHAINNIEAVAMMRPSDLNKETSDISLNGMVRLNINTASEKELKLVPGIGGNLARRIVESRPFDSIWNLVQLEGVSKKRFQELEPYLTLK